MGKAWEKVLERAHDDYRKHRVACILRAHPPIRVLSRKDIQGRFQAVWEGNGPPDFVGALTRTGRAVVFDAKHSSAHTWRLANLERHQAMDLEAMPHGFAFVALRMEQRAWVLPWTTLGPIYWTWVEGEAKRGEAQVNAQLASQIGWEFDARDGDWYSVVPQTVLYPEGS